jgi:tetratricopeptide (TPR) repeat protein
MYFDLVDEKTKSILEALMKKAYNYMDFTSLIAERACLEDVPQFLPFMAVLHSSKLWNMRSLDQLAEIYSNDPLMRPYLLYIKSGLGEEVDWQGVLDATQIVLDSNPAEWIALHMQLLNHTVASGSHREQLRAYSLATIGNMIRTNDELSCFSPEYWFLQAALWSRIEDHQKRFSLAQKALELAREYNDKYSEGYGFRTLASISFSIDVQQSQEYPHYADIIFEELGHKLGRAENYGTLSGVFQVRGDYDRALECLFESMKIRESMGLDNWIIPTNVAWIYSTIRNYNAALEWSEYALISICMCDNLLGYPHLQRARALINVGRTKDAIEHLDLALKYALREGDERLMKLFDVTMTLFQRAKGDFSSALLNLEGYIHIDYPTLNVFDLNEYLLLLAETEVFAFESDDENLLSEYSGPWMERLEERARDNEMAGILGLALILKARLRLKQNRTGAAKYLLEEVQQMGQIHNMEFLSEQALFLRTRAGLIDS